MDIANPRLESAVEIQNIHWGHFGVVLATMLLLLGVSWMKNPQLFDFKKTNALAAGDPSVPKYYAYVQPAGLSQPLVAGASTDQGPVVISDDGSNTVVPVDTGKVLGASTQDAQLAYADIKVNKTIPDSADAIKKYLTDSAAIKTGPIDSLNFESALSSNNQQLIDQQASKLVAVRDDLQKMPVPQGLVKFHQLTIVQYNSAISLLQNFTQADNNPQQVGNYLQDFLQSQQNLQTESTALAAKYNLDINLFAVGAIDTSQLSAPAGATTDGNVQQ